MNDALSDTGLDTFPKLLLRNAAQFADVPSMREKEFGIWQTWTWAEAGPFLTAQHADAVRSDTVGVPLADVEVKIDEHGEVIFRSPGAFSEYYKNPEATRARGCTIAFPITAHYPVTGRPALINCGPVTT